MAGKRLFMVSVAGFSMDSAVAGGFNILEVSSDSSFLGFLGLVSVAGFLWFPSWQENCCYGFRRWLLNGFRRGKEHLFMVSVVGLFMASGCYRTAAFSPMETIQKEIRTFP